MRAERREEHFEKQNLFVRDGHWNPTVRMAQMRQEYDRLVRELGMSPRGTAIKMPPPTETVLSARSTGGLPRVPADRPWATKGPNARSRRLKEAAAEAPAGAVVPLPAAPGATAPAEMGPAAFLPKMHDRLDQSIDMMEQHGHLTHKQAAQLKALQRMQEKLLAEAYSEEAATATPAATAAALAPPPPPAAPEEAEGEGGADATAAASTPRAEGREAMMLAAATQLLEWLDDPEHPADAAPEGADGAAAAPAAEGEGEEGGGADAEGGRGGGAAPSAAPAAAAAAPSAEAEAEPEARAVAGVPRRLSGLLSKNLTRVIDVFRQWDADGDGQVTKAEFSKGLTKLKMQVEPADIDALFAHFDPDGSGSLDFKELNAVLRGAARDKHEAKQKAAAAKAGAPEKSAQEKAREAAEQVLRPQDLVGARSHGRVEEALRSGRLPSLSPDDEEPHAGDAALGGRRKEAGGESAVWSMLEGRLLPNGLGGAPAWQREMLQRVHWQVEVKRAAHRREAHAALAAQRGASGVPTWRSPRGGGGGGGGGGGAGGGGGGGGARPKPRLLQRELRQQQATEEAQGEAAAREAALREAGGAAMTSHARRKAAAAAAAAMAARVEELDVSRAHRQWLAEAAREAELEQTARLNKLAFYEQGLQQQQLERQELEHDLEEARQGVRDVEAQAGRGRRDAAGHAARRRRERLTLDVDACMRKANRMDAITQTLMHVIGSLRKGRKRHLEAAAGQREKGAQIEADAQFLMSSATAALEERERVRSKAERVKFESAAARQLQLREAASLQEQLQQLDDEHAELEAKLTELSERAKQQQYVQLRGGRDAGEGRALRYGFLRSQAAGWAREFARISEMTGVSFGAEGDGLSEGWDAVEKVVAIYSEKEARNASLFKYVTEDVTRQREALEAALLRLTRTEAHLEAALAAQPPPTPAAAPPPAAAAAAGEAPAAPAAAPPADAAADADADGDADAAAGADGGADGGAGGGEGEGEGEGEEGPEPGSAAARLARESGAWQATLGEALPVLDRVGWEMGLGLPQHLEGKGCSLTTYAEFLSLLEAQMHALFSTAHALCAARARRAPPEEDDGEAAPGKHLETLEAWTRPRHLFRGGAVVLKPKDDAVLPQDMAEA